MGPESQDLTPEELHAAVRLAWSHVGDKPLVDACCGGQGVLAEYFELNYQQYLQLLETVRVEEVTLKVKRENTKARRSQYSARRPQLVLGMLDSGKQYICSHPDCSITENLTIDHIVALSRGGSDELDNLQFLCRSHNSSKGDGDQ